MFWFKDRTIRISSLTVDDKDGRVASKEELLTGWDLNESEGEQITKFEKEHLAGKAVVRKTSEDGGEYWCLQGCMACGEGANRLAIVTICYDGPSDEGWARSTFESVFHPAP